MYVLQFPMSSSGSGEGSLASAEFQADATDDPDPIDTAAIGLLPSQKKFMGIFTRITGQLDFLNRTANMMIARLDYLERDIEDLRQSNFSD
jgi:hypothetical protein